MAKRRDDDGFIDRGLVHDDRQARVPGTEHHAIAHDRLRSLVQRIEGVESEKKALGEDIKDLYAETKSAGFDPKVVRRLVAERKREPAEVVEEDSLLDLYRRALGG